jgi:hypothetical protein
MGIVNQISTSGDQDALVPQWREPPADLEMECCRLSFVDTKLHDRNVGIGVHVPKH